MATKKLKPVKTPSVSNEAAAVTAATTNDLACSPNITQNATTQNNTETTTQTTETMSDQQVTEQTSDNQALTTETIQEAYADETVAGGLGEDTVESYSGKDSISSANQDTVTGAIGEDGVSNVFAEYDDTGASKQDNTVNQNTFGRGETSPIVAIDESPFQENSHDTSLAEPVVANIVSFQEPPAITVEETNNMGTLSAATIVGDGTAAVGVANQTANTAGEAFAAAVYTAGENYWMQEYKILGYSETLTKILLDILGIDSKATSTCKEQLKSVLYYAHYMGPHSCGDEATNKLNQTKFFNDFTLFLNVGCDDFRKAMSVSLAIVNESLKNGTGFSGVLPFRYMESLSGPVQLREGIAAIMHLLTTTADPAKRALTVKQVDIPKCVAFGVSEAGKQRLMDFYSA